MCDCVLGFSSHMYTLDSAPWYTFFNVAQLYCTYCCMPKGTYRAEAMTNQELAVSNLQLSEGISEVVSQSVEFC